MSSTASSSEQQLELRCFCSKQPLLAVCGRDAHGQPYVHVRAVRSGGANSPPKLQAEMIVTAGVASIRCRLCLRWHRIAIRRTDVDFRPAALPSAISV